MTTFRRGDGVGIELSGPLLRGIRLDDDVEGRLASAAEVAIAGRGDDRAVVDAFVRLRAELGNPGHTTRIATFPPASTLHRLEVTGRSGAELNAVRAQLAREQSIVSTLLLDDGPRRWLVAVRWEEHHVRRMEELAERAGFVDVTVEPSPVAIARVVEPTVTRVRRDSATDEAFELLCTGRQPVVAAAVDSVGRVTPSLALATDAFSPGWFDGIDQPGDLVAELRRFVDGLVVDERTDDVGPLWIAGTPYPLFPQHDLRSPQRQCVALGAAVGAAGLAGRLRPVDISVPVMPSIGPLDRPWAVERLSSLPPKAEPTRIGPFKRAISRLPTRRRPSGRSTSSG